MKLFKSLIKNLYNYFFVCVIILFYLSEGISKYFYYYLDQKILLPRNIKIVIVFLFILFLLFKKKWNKIILYAILVGIFILGQVFLKNNSLKFENLIVLTKYLFPLLFFESAYLYFKNQDKKTFYIVFEYIIIINFILIILGLIFDIYLFKTYGIRFGFNGLFITSATSSYFYIIAIFYLYLIRNKSKYFLFLCVITLMSSLLVGTKSIFLFLMFLVLYIAIYQINKRYRFKALISAFGLIVILTGSFFIFEPHYFDSFKGYNLLTVILSFRDQLLIDNTFPFVKENWTFINYLFGGIGNTLNRSQLGLFDLILTYGFIGSILYLTTYFKSFFKNKLTKNSIFYLISISLIIALGGNFFFSATIVIYLVVIQLKLMEQNH